MASSSSISSQLPQKLHGNREPAPKRRKLDVDETPSSSQGGPSASQPSFAERLAEMSSRAATTETFAEGGSDLWDRAPLPAIDPERDAIIFQQIEIEDEQWMPLIRMYGVTENGNSVSALITDFHPYLYVPAPKPWNDAEQAAMEDVLGNVGTIRSIELVERKGLWGYSGDENVAFLKITLEQQRDVPKRGELPQWWEAPVPTFESNIAYILRFMIDTKVVGMNWIEVPAGGYRIEKADKKKTRCQLEITLSWTAFKSHPPDDQWSRIAPLRVLSFDIECAGRKGVFPTPDRDPVIQIANMVTRQGESEPFIRNIFCLNTCANIVGSHVLSFEDEGEMLCAWAEFIQQVDPDLLIGYNIGGFDFPYLMDRAAALKAVKFPFLGRLSRIKTEVKKTHFSSKAYGTRESKETPLSGRLQLDLLAFMQREHKLRSYSLNSVCSTFLGEQKEDVHHSVITELQNGTPESRRRLAVYCLKDAYLPQRLMDKLMCFINYIEMSRVTGVPFNYLLARGQSIKVLSQLFRRANDEGYVIPSLKTEGSDEQYEGATVIEPKKGYYDSPIATLDFASLYPSIMMAHNLCYTTLLTHETIKAKNLVEGRDYVKTPNNDCFINSTKRKGILPAVLEDLISARKRAKLDLKKETDPFKRAVLDGRQLALKISANSVYGFTGATIGKLPCLAISSSVTAFGRQMIEFTKQEVESEYSIANGHEYDAEVIYGDTDSVMVKFGPSELEAVMRIGAEAAEFVTQKFTKPIKLEFEKVYFPYLLISKKRYAGLYWTRPEAYDKMDTKGIETVRRDNCRLVSTVIETCLNKMLIHRDVRGAEDYAKRMIADLLLNKIDMSQLVITKALAKEEYAGKQAHKELADRMKIRDPGSAPAMGDRVAYVIIKGTKGAAAYEKSEDPIYVLENNIPIDTRYYLDNQLSKPLLRIFEPILGEKAQGLLAGEHTRTIQIATPTTGGLMKFAVKTVTCLGCKTPLKASNSKKNAAVCNGCRPKVAELYNVQITKTSKAQVKFSKLWTECQRCQGSLHQDVLCSAKDCPIFYMRKKAQKEAEDSEVILQRFDEELW